jgi:ectoine hydroxylase-related dioxygenase (phytanoyl-CoA dioxygenase family)
MQELAHLDRESASQAVLDALARDGAVIVDDLLEPAIADAILREARPFLERSSPGEEDFGGTRTVRSGALVARCPACRPVVLHPLVIAAARALLSPSCERFQLHVSQLIQILPGESTQPLHRDRLVFGRHLSREIEPQLNTLWAMTDFTRDNGATRVIPGSQGWDWDRAFEGETCAQAVMPRGSVLIYTGSVVHGAGANRSTDARVGMNLTYSLAWLRQEENQYLSCPPEVARTLSPALQELVGYTTGDFALGYWSSPQLRNGPGSDLQDPEQALGRAKRGHGFGSAEQVRSGDRF